MSIGGIDLNGFDMVVILVVLISLIMAASRGLARELISILALIIAIFGALFIWGQLRFAAQDFISPAWLADGALALGSFSIIYMIVIALMSGVKKSLLGKDIGLINRILGGGFGAARGLVVMALFVMIPTASYVADRDRIEEERENIEDRTDIPDDIRERLLEEQQSLPEWLESSTTYPILENIGDALRTLPFADVKQVAEDLKDGELPDILDSEEPEDE